jgi:hypothetical protein
MIVLLEPLALCELCKMVNAGYDQTLNLQHSTKNIITKATGQIPDNLHPVINKRSLLREVLDAKSSTGVGHAHAST